MGKDPVMLSNSVASFTLSWTSGKRSSRQVPKKTPPAKQLRKLITRSYKNNPMA